ncbi:2'-O-methyl transferase [Listeria ivanovii]|uniref:2'-O-methyl transferase n=2 Tax=Listeria ivanovii TaxID=1638 RepID=UPI0019443AF6|nr:2'-O-methyl transferase [Listeria ivanovii]
MPIANGEQPLTENSLLDLFVIVAIGVFFSIFIFKETFEKQYKKEKSEKDERYFRNRNTFSFYFIIISAILVPILLTVLSTQKKVQVSLSSLAIGYIVICFFYMFCLEIIQRKA